MVTQQLLVIRECRSVNIYGGLDPRQNRSQRMSSTTSTEKPEADTTAAVQQTVHATDVGLNAVYKIRSEAKSTGGLFPFYF